MGRWEGRLKGVPNDSGLFPSRRDEMRRDQSYETTQDRSTLGLESCPWRSHFCPVLGTMSFSPGSWSYNRFEPSDIFYVIELGMGSG